MPRHLSTMKPGKKNLLAREPIKTRYYLLLAIAVFHFFMVALGAWHIKPFTSFRPLAFLTELYQAYSGADSGYEFFAPEVGSQLRVVFELADAKGQRWTANLEKGQAGEADLRIGNIINIFWDQDFDKSMQRSLAASWAGIMLGRYRQAQEITLRVQEYYLPSMEEFRNGARPSWQDYYTAKFQAKSPRKTRDELTTAQ